MYTKICIPKYFFPFFNNCWIITHQLKHQGIEIIDFEKGNSFNRYYISWHAIWFLYPYKYYNSLVGRNCTNHDCYAKLTYRPENIEAIFYFVAIGYACECYKIVLSYHVSYRSSCRSHKRWIHSARTCYLMMLKIFKERQWGENLNFYIFWNFNF